MKRRERKAAKAEEDATSGFDRKIAGLLVTDASERVYLAHSGKVGGGKKGVGKGAFVAAYSGESFASVSWPDGKASDVILLADINDSRLAAQSATFVHEVDRFKSGDKLQSTSSGNAVRGISFAPEFEGERARYRVGQQLESQCNHGTIVRYLRAQLEDAGFQVGNARARDLVVANARGGVTAFGPAPAEKQDAALASCVRGHAICSSEAAAESGAESAGVRTKACSAGSSSSSVCDGPGNPLLTKELLGFAGIVRSAPEP